MKRFKYIDHLSDIGIEFYGNSMEELFENAGLGMFSIISDPGKVDPVKKKSIVVKREKINLEDLLILWLEELLYIFDTDNMIFSDFKVKSINGPESRKGPESPGSGGFELKATAGGEMVDQSRHDIKIGIKAPTYHKLEIKKEKGNRWTGRVIFDV